MSTENKPRGVRHLDVAKLSPTMQRLNPHLMGIPVEKIKEGIVREMAPEPKTKTAGKRRSAMNKTEARFARLLEAKVARGEIVSFEYEGLTLRWPDGMRYTPDFIVVRAIGRYGDAESGPMVSITLIEVKGTYGWAKDIVKFRAARDKWGERFRFEFYQEVDGEWQETR